MSPSKMAAVYQTLAYHQVPAPLDLMTALEDAGYVLRTLKPRNHWPLHDTLQLLQQHGCEDSLEYAPSPEDTLIEQEGRFQEALVAFAKAEEIEPAPPVVIPTITPTKRPVGRPRKA